MRGTTALSEGLSGSTCRPRHVLLSGCSGGGKSTLLAELARQGSATVPEPGRRIVAEELLGSGSALPWVDLAAFAARALDMAAEDRQKATSARTWTFFDRGLIDAAVALQHATGAPVAETLAAFPRYHRRVFLTPPWPEIFTRDRERRQDLDEAVAEYDRLLSAINALGYHVTVLPRTSVEERVRFILERLGEP
ncbi:AAA family ATPase [Sphingomonas aracearum]|uniref:ATPase n=1 Tax=Sphingomonas aracearum TaxID=2283317 RepID=A0A369VXP1_9SPHN|nr:AAA family ATPase [Sphingomonas aracearum]RDE06377.1 ATPase [Sphingomonas aracearum]